jgi:hypothetical protein
MEREDPPDPDAFPIYTQDNGTEDRNEMYYERLEEYEKTQLLRFFLKEMQRVCPEWVEVHKASELQVGFEEVVKQFGLGLFDEQIDTWIDGLRRMEPLPLLRVFFATSRRSLTVETTAATVL